MSDLAAKISALETALATGTLTVESGGDRVTYRSVSDLTRALDYFKAQQVASGGVGGQRYSSTLAVFGGE